MAGDDELRTVVSSPTFDEMLAEREREAGGGDDDIETAKTAMALSYDERLAQMEAARAAGADPAGASGERATIPQPEARPDPFAPPPARDPFAPAPFGASPFAGAPPAASPSPAVGPPPAAPPRPAPAAPPSDGVLPKTVMLSASDWQIPGPPGGPPAPSAPGMPASPGPAAPYAAPGAAPGPYGAPPATAPAYGAPPMAAPAKKGMSPLVLFGIGLGATFVVGSCLAAAAIVFLMR